MPGEMQAEAGAASGGCSTLYDGCVYRGSQTSNDRRYEVEVRFKHVDLQHSYLCGDLMIKGLTEQYPELTTFFEAEIIGDKHAFVTGKWEASEDVDLQHWSKFKSFERVADKFSHKAQSLNVTSSEHVFMRWKEQFLVPDHKISSIKGASFAGFYYICFHRQTGKIEGYYYHSKSDLFQALELHLEQDRQFATYQFR